MSTEKITLTASDAGRRLSDVLSERGIFLPAPCGGRGVCGKCRVSVLSGTFLSVENGAPLLPDAERTILACRAVCTAEGAVLLCPESDGTGQTEMPEAPGAAPGGTGEGEDCAALDIGTTTLAAARVTPDGRVVRTTSRLNPQQSRGADVISRICACAAGKLGELQRVLLEAVREMLRELFPESPDGMIPVLTAAGNTTMLHIFLGVSPERMGVYPFTPEFTAARCVTGSLLGLPVRSVRTLPSVSAYIGGDITAGMAVCGLGSSAVPTLLLDLGTNGEMVLDCGPSRRLLAAATAAGPALEGACISCGMGGVRGAVNRVRLDRRSGILTAETIGGAPPRGLCGAGLIDLCACLLDRGEMDESGCLEDGDYPLCAAHETEAGIGEVIRMPVTLTQKDVREFQLAKSAVRSGIEALLDAGGLTAQSFAEAGGRVLIAGGLGCRMDPASAVRTGMFPPAFAAISRSVGNTALAGAVRVLTLPGAAARMAELAASCTEISLDRSPVFSAGFIENMTFPGE